MLELLLGDIRSDFNRNADGWSTDDVAGVLSYETYDHLIAVESKTSNPTPAGYAYFKAPKRYLGDQRASYNQELRFSLKTLDAGARTSNEDVVIEGGGARTTRISLDITAQGNPQPSGEVRSSD